MTGIPEGTSIRDIIDNWAGLIPDEIFLIDPSSNKEVTYSQLRDGCRSVASFISSKGIEKGEPVGYALHNGAAAAKTILGILYGGFMATAINLVSGNQTISYVVEHSDVRLIFCQDETEKLLTEAVLSDKHDWLVSVSDALFTSLETSRSVKPHVLDNGLLMYTSGTTGTPKGVVLTHGNLIAGGTNTMMAHELSRADRGLCVLPLYHINGLCVTLLGALVSGGSLIIPQRFSVSGFWDFLRRNRGTWFSVVPTQISYLLNEVTIRRHSNIGLELLRFGRSASAPLSPDVQRAFEDTFNIPIIETMGLTECAAQILSNPMHGERKIGSPGIAYGNEIIIADHRQKELDRGNEGEVLVRGPNVMKEYLRNADATYQSLTDDHWLRTGDLGRMDEEGFVFITGRLKELSN